MNVLKNHVSELSQSQTQKYFFACCSAWVVATISFMMKWIVEDIVGTLIVWYFLIVLYSDCIMN
jgi:hypothetical protein